MKTRKLRNALLLAAGMIVGCSCSSSDKSDESNEQPDGFAKGADISWVTELESNGHKFYNASGQERECTALMKELGLNAIRLRVWVDPKKHDNWCNTADMVAKAERADRLGMDVMVDFHYSDWWADPGQQHKPAAWEGLGLTDLKKAMADHTREVLQTLKAKGITPKWVQVGNETTNGFLWPVGRTSDNMENYASFTQAGYEAVKEVYPDAKVIVHLDGGCDHKRYDFIFDGLRKYGAKWDIIGLSVYPYWDIEAKLETDWQGTVRDFTENIRYLSQKYSTECMVVETGVEAKKPKEGKTIMKAIINAA